MGRQEVWGRVFGEVRMKLEEVEKRQADRWKRVFEEDRRKEERRKGENEWKGLENRTFLWRRNLEGRVMLRSKNIDLVFSSFSFSFYFSIFRTLGLGLEVIGHTSHIWWCGHNIDHRT